MNKTAVRSGCACSAASFLAAAVIVSLLAGCAATSQETAATRESVAAAAKWTAVFVDDDPEPILALYDDAAVLWGTLSPTRASGIASLFGPGACLGCAKTTYLRKRAVVRTSRSCATGI